MSLLYLIITPLFYFYIAIITVAKIIDNYLLHSPECKGCRNDR